MCPQQGTAAVEHTNPTLLTGMPLRRTLTVSIPRCAKRVTNHFQAVPTTHSAEHPESGVRFTLRVGIKGHSFGVSPGKTTERLDRTIPDDHQSSADTMYIRSGFDVTSNLLATKQSAKVSNEDHDRRLMRPHRAKLHRLTTGVNH